MVDRDPSSLHANSRRPAGGRGRAPARRKDPARQRELTDALRDAIVRDEVRPGERLNERVLCERFGVSRTPLREALKALAAEGLVVLLPNRGARVAAPTREELSSAYELISGLESLAGSLAAARMRDEDIDAVRALHYEMRVHHARGRLADYFRCNQRIHEAIVAGAGNPLLAETYARLAMRLRHARYVSNHSKERWDEAMREHDGILAALEARDAPRLARALAEHVRMRE